jgi:hypothetical protein
MTPIAPAAPLFGLLDCCACSIRVGVVGGAFVPGVVLPAFRPECDGGNTPAVVFDHRRPGELTSKVLLRVGGYLNTGVTAVVVLEPRQRAAGVYNQELGFAGRVTNGDELTLPDVLPGFAVPVRRFFE